MRRRPSRSYAALSKEPVASIINLLQFIPQERALVSADLLSSACVANSHKTRFRLADLFI
jgi:hypothetical protein